MHKCEPAAFICGLAEFICESAAFICASATFIRGSAAFIYGSITFICFWDNNTPKFKAVWCGWGCFQLVKKKKKKHDSIKW